MRDTRRKIAAATAALAGAAMFLTLTGVNNNAAADTENCVSHAEYDQTDVFMSVARIAEIYDVNGTYFDTDDPDTFARIYHTLCWTSSQEIKITFDQQSGLTIRWRLQDK